MPTTHDIKLGVDYYLANAAAYPEFNWKEMKSHDYKWRARFAHQSRQWKHRIERKVKDKLDQLEKQSDGLLSEDHSVRLRAIRVLQGDNPDSSAHLNKFRVCNKYPPETYEHDLIQRVVPSGFTGMCREGIMEILREGLNSNPLVSQEFLAQSLAPISQAAHLVTDLDAGLEKVLA